MSTGMQSLHPLTCFIYYAGIVTFGLLLLHPVLLGMALAVLIVLHGLQDGAAKLRRWGFVYAAGALLLAVVNPLISHRGRTVLFYFMDQPVTLESFVYGCTMALSLLVVLFALLSSQLVIGPSKFLYLFASVMPRSALAAMLAVRFVPLLRRRLVQIALVQRTRGVDPRQGPFRKRMKDGMLLMQLLLTWSMEEALQTADSMKARGYGVSRTRTAYQPYRFTRLDRMLAVLFAVCAAGCLAGWAAGFGTLAIYPELGRWELQGGDWLVLACLTIYAAVPAALEGKERWQWRSWK